MTTLLTFLDETGAGLHKNSPHVTYRFPDERTIVGAHCGLALAQWAQVDRLVILGTPSAPWDRLIEHSPSPLGDEDQAMGKELMARAKKGTVDDDLLQRARPVVERSVGRPCAMHVIPAGTDAAIQGAFLKQLVSWMMAEERLMLDVTHGPRHLAMLAVVAGLFLPVLARGTIEAIFCGTQDMATKGTIPVVRLDGLLEIPRWIMALARIDAGAGYADLVPLLTADGLPQHKAALLDGTALQEATGQVQLLAENLRVVYQALSNPMQGMAELFREPLQERLSWASHADLAIQQRALAQGALNRGNWQHALALGIEAAITLKCQQLGMNHMHHDHRLEARRQLEIEREIEEPAYPFSAAALAYEKLQEAQAAMRGFSPFLLEQPGWHEDTPSEAWFLQTVQEGIAEFVTGPGQRPGKGRRIAQRSTEGRGMQAALDAPASSDTARHEEIEYVLDAQEIQLIDHLMAYFSPHRYYRRTLPDMYLSFEKPPLFAVYPALEEEYIRDVLGDIKRGRGGPFHDERRRWPGRMDDDGEPIRPWHPDHDWDELERRLARLMEDDEYSGRRHRDEYKKPEWVDIEELLGVYHPSPKPRITLYAMGLAWHARHMGVDPAWLTSVVLVHEAGHWLTHQLPQHASRHHPALATWPTAAYQATSSMVHEGWAQIVTWWLVREYGGRLQDAFLKLNQGQSPKYKVYQRIQGMDIDHVIASLQPTRAMSAGATLRDWFGMLGTR